MIEKEVHGFECSSDIHCTASEKHFHSLEHHCAICDFTISNSNTPPKTDFQLINSVHHFSFQLFNESIQTPIAFQHLPSRAPPIA